MKKSTLLLKVAVALLGLPVLVVGVIGIPWLLNNPASSNYDQILYPIIVGLYLSIIPFFLALYQGFKLLTYISISQSFSKQSVESLKKVKYCAFVISGLYIMIMPFLYWLAEVDDAPGIIIMGAVPIFASLVIAVFSAVLQRLLQEAIEIKIENQLTI